MAVDIDTVETWLKENKDKPRSQVDSKSKLSCPSLSCSHLFKDNGREQLPPRVRKPYQRSKSATTLKFEKDVDDFKNRLIAGELILMSEFADRDKSNTFRIVTRAREADLDILTITRASVAIGWVLAPVAFAKLAEKERK